MPEIFDHIKLIKYEQNEGSWIKDDENLDFFEFQINPSSIEITNEITVVESNFLRQDGGIIRPTQRKLRRISGSGKFMDIPDGNFDAYPLVSRYKGYTNCFDMYKSLLTYMNMKQIFRFVHPNFGEIYCIIQTLNVTNNSSWNAIEFTFNLIETLVPASNKTGFERDTQQQQPGMAVASRTETTDTVQYKEYKVVQGDTLSKIALKFYGNASKWTLIYDYNRDVLTRGPNVLTIGTILKIPNASAPLKVSGGVTPTTKYTQSSTKQELLNGTVTINGQGYSVDVNTYPDWSLKQDTEKKVEALGYCSANLQQQTINTVVDTFNRIWTNTINAFKPTTQKNLTGAGSILS